MLLNLHKKDWTEGLRLKDFELHKQSNEKTVKVCIFLLTLWAPPLEPVGNDQAVEPLTQFHGCYVGYAVSGFIVQQIRTGGIDPDSGTVSHLSYITSGFP